MGLPGNILRRPRNIYQFNDLDLVTQSYELVSDDYPRLALLPTRNSYSGDRH